MHAGEMNIELISNKPVKLEALADKKTGNKIFRATLSSIEYISKLASKSKSRNTLQSHYIKLLALLYKLNFPFSSQDLICYFWLYTKLSQRSVSRSKLSSVEKLNTFFIGNFEEVMLNLKRFISCVNYADKSERLLWEAFTPSMNSVLSSIVMNTEGSGFISESFNLFKQFRNMVKHKLPIFSQDQEGMWHPLHRKERTFFYE